MLTKQHIPLMVLAAAVGLSGCEGTSEPVESGDLTFDAAVVAADGALEDLEVMHGPGLGLPNAVFPGLIQGRPDCPMTLDVFLCDPIERDGLTYTRTVTYFDAVGNTQTAYDEATTASIHYEITVQGDRSRQGWSATIDRSRDLTVTGLLDGVGAVTWNGTGSDDVVRSHHFRDGEERTHDMSAASRIAEVVVPYPRTEESWPLSGTISRSLTITRTRGDVTETVQKEVLVEFNGTSEVTVTVDGETFILDLTQRMRHGRHMRRGGGRGRG